MIVNRRRLTRKRSLDRYFRIARYLECRLGRPMPVIMHLLQTAQRLYPNVKG